LVPEKDEEGYRPERILRAELARQIQEGKAQTEADRLNALIPDVPLIKPGELP